MADTPYVYSISVDFAASHKVAPDRLREEITGSAIVTALRDILTLGDDCTITFKDALSSGDETILDGIVAVHSGEPLPDVLPVQPVKVIDTEGLDPATATSCTEFVEVEVNPSESVSEGSISYPFPVDVAAARYVMEDPHYEYGDKFDVFGIPAGDPAIGGVGVDAESEQTYVFVSSTVFQYVKPGLYLKFANHDGEYRIESVDPENSKIELMTPLEADVPLGTLIQVRRPFLINGWVCKNLLYAIGDMTSGSSKLNAGDSIRIRYYHKTTPTESYTLPFALAMLF